MVCLQGLDGVLPAGVVGFAAKQSPVGGGDEGVGRQVQQRGQRYTSPRLQVGRREAVTLRRTRRGQHMVYLRCLRILQASPQMSGRCGPCLCSGMQGLDSCHALWNSHDPNGNPAVHGETNCTVLMTG